MEAKEIDLELIQHLCRNFNLDPEQANRIVSEVTHFFDESYQQFIGRRHRELQLRGWSNELIFNALTKELEHRRFPAPALTKRQLRRSIYG